MPETKPTPKLNISDLRKMRDDAAGALSTAHTNYRHWIKFSHGVKDAQWDPAVLANRRGRPSQQYNICPGFIRPTVNAAKEAPPEIQVHPISEATKEQAQALSGALRSIQYKCNASRAYLWALECAMRGGLGGWKIVPKKVRGQVEFLVQPILDATTVLVDQAAQEIDFSDAKWIIIETQVAEDDYKTDYPGGIAIADDGKVKIWEAWVERTERIDVPGEASEERIHIDYYVFDDATDRPLVYQDRYPGTYIPVVLITGPMAFLDGKREFFSITHDIEPMQKEVNWLKSEQIAQRSSYPKAQGFAEDAAIEEYQDEWENSALGGAAWLKFKAGQKPPVPFDPPPPASGDIEATKENIDMARQVTGIYPDPTLQAKADTPSGKAIKQQRLTSGVANYHYHDAMNFGMKRTGDILVELVTLYWNDDQIRMAMGADSSVFPVSFGPSTVPDVQNIDLAKARFGITVSVGPSYPSQREEKMDRLNEFLKDDPAGKAVLRDVFVKLLDIPGTEEAAARFVAMLPPEVRDVAMKENGEPAEQLLRARMQLQQLGQKAATSDKLVQALTQALQKETEALKAKRDELASRERIAAQAQQEETHRTNLKLASQHLIEDQRADLDIRLQEMEATLALVLQARENESDARLAQQGERVQVMA